MTARLVLWAEPLACYNGKRENWRFVGYFGLKALMFVVRTLGHGVLLKLAMWNSHDLL